MLRDILKDAIDLARAPISDNDFIHDFNRVCHDLAMLYDTAKKRATQTIVCADTSTEYPLTAGCLRIERVLDRNSNYYRHFTVRGNSKIMFAFTGTYTVYETFDQAPITSMDATPAIDTAYNKAIAEFIAAKAVKKSDPEYSKELMASSAADAALANNNIRKADNPNRKVRAPLFR
jgi:hypothetical protein